MFSNDSTKSICTCTFVSMILSLLFIASPLSNFRKTSLFVKCIVLALIAYVAFMTIKQIEYLQNQIKQTILPDISNQLNINLTCSYVFILFLGLLFLFVLKSFF